MQMASVAYSKNPYLRNSQVTELWLFLLRRGWSKAANLLGLCLGSQIACKIPSRLFLPHPFGIVVSAESVLSEDVVLLQQVTLGARYPYGKIGQKRSEPVLHRGVYAGPGARILGEVSVGEYSIIGANAVLTESVPPYSIVVGHNKILQMKSTELEQRILASEI
jgi:serine O-acetyltransferase